MKNVAKKNLVIETTVRAIPIKEIAKKVDVLIREKIKYKNLLAAQEERSSRVREQVRCKNHVCHVVNDKHKLSSNCFKRLDRLNPMQCSPNVSTVPFSPVSKRSSTPSRTCPTRSLLTTGLFIKTVTCYVG